MTLTDWCCGILAAGMGYHFFHGLAKATSVLFLLLFLHHSKSDSALQHLHTTKNRCRIPCWDLERRENSPDHHPDPAHPIKFLGTESPETSVISLQSMDFRRVLG